MGESWRESFDFAHVDSDVNVMQMQPGSLIHPGVYVSGLCHVAQVADGGDTLWFLYRDGCHHLLLSFFFITNFKQHKLRRWTRRGMPGSMSGERADSSLAGAASPAQGRLGRQRTLLIGIYKERPTQPEALVQTDTQGKADARQTCLCLQEACSVVSLQRDPAITREGTWHHCMRSKNDQNSLV